MIGSSKISIITPTLNAEKYLRQTIDSIAAQQYQDLEYIIVDGGSTDQTLEIVKNSGIVTRWISEPDHGIGDAFNKGIRMTTGEIVGILNADDYYHDGALVAVSEAVEAHPDCGIYYGDAMHEAFDGSYAFRFSPPRDLSYAIRYRMPLSHPAVFVRREAYIRHGAFDTRFKLAMDYELIMRMHCSGVRFHQIEHVLAHFRCGQDRRNDGLREVREISIKYGLPSLEAYGRYALACFKARFRFLKTVIRFTAN